MISAENQQILFALQERNRRRKTTNRNLLMLGDTPTGSRALAQVTESQGDIENSYYEVTHRAVPVLHTPNLFTARRHYDSLA